MNKADLVTLVAQKSGLSKKDSEAAVNALVASIEEGLVKDEKVTLVGFGTFEVRKRAARKAGTIIRIPFPLLLMSDASR